MLTLVSASNDPSIPTCPKCASTQIERGPETIRFLDLNNIDATKHLTAAVPPSIRCLNCKSEWHESDLDPTSARFAFLQAEYAKQASA